nr:hypothetical protein [Tanacetum cinerariifolium]
EELAANIALANNLLDVLTRYHEQMHSRGPEMFRVESLPADPRISYDFHTLQRTTKNDMRNFSNLVAARSELLRTIAQKEELIKMHSRRPEMLRVESLPADPRISYDLHTLQRTTENDMRNSSNLVAATSELLRTIAQKEELIKVYRAM